MKDVEIFQLNDATKLGNRIIGCVACFDGHVYRHRHHFTVTRKSLCFVFSELVG